MQKIKTFPVPNALKIEKLYQNYLTLVKASEDRMPEIQRQETKRAFMGGIAQILGAVRTELTVYPDHVAAGILEQIWQDLGNYWAAEAEKQNGSVN